LGASEFKEEKIQKDNRAERGDQKGRKASHLRMTKEGGTISMRSENGLTPAI